MRRLSIKGITRGRSQFIPDEKALNGPDKSSREGISFGLTAKKTVAQAYFKPLRAKVSSQPPSRQSIKGCAVFRVSLTARSAVCL